MCKVFFLMLGGAIGSGLRFGVSSWVQHLIPHAFPWGILSVNVIGSLLIGFCWSLAEAFHFSAQTRAFLFTGLFGGFTTFSSFALDSSALFRNGEAKLALLNIVLSNALGLIAVFAGLYVGKQCIGLLK